MLSTFLNSSTCIYLSLAIDDGVTMTSKRREKSQFHMFFFPSFKLFFCFCHSHFFLVVSWERALEVVVVACSRKRKVQISMKAGMRTVVPFCVSIPSL